MLRLCIALILTELFFGGFAMAQICVTDSGITLGGHGSEQGCVTHKIQVIPMEGQKACTDCKDVALGDADEDYSVQRLARDLKMEPVLIFVFTVFRTFSVSLPEERIVVSDSWMAAPSSHFFQPLETIVLRN